MSVGKANNLSKEILDRNVSDLLDVASCIHKLSKKGNLKRDKHGYFLHYSVRGANITEFCHKTLLTTCRSWLIGIESSDCALMERNHRNNQTISVKRRVSCPNLGHCNV